jgi:hypothetical protein
MSLITITEFREHYETDLSDTALQRIIDSQEALMVRRFGPHETQSQVFNPNYSKVLYPYRRISSIMSIVEKVGDEETTLETDDYDVIATGRRIDRLSTGTNPRTYWEGRVTVIYVPTGQADERKMVLIDLCKLTCEYNALKSENSGDYSMSQKEYKKERDELLSQLNDGIGIA